MMPVVLASRGFGGLCCCVTPVLRTEISPCDLLHSQLQVVFYKVRLIFSKGRTCLEK